ncbi:MAG: hypothetical protein K0R67_3192 [Paenibacillus sp.]|jgi:hypothetical protein|nr:hypothetical protein [Paenibacillus sp.]
MAAHDHLSVMELRQVQGVAIERTKALPGTGTYLLLQDVDSSLSHLEGNDFSKAVTGIQLKETQKHTHNCG